MFFESRLIGFGFLDSVGRMRNSLDKAKEGAKIPKGRDVLDDDIQALPEKIADGEAELDGFSPDSVAAGLASVPAEKVDVVSDIDIFNITINSDGLVYKGEKSDLSSFIDQKIKSYNLGDWKTINTKLFGVNVSKSFIKDMQEKLGFTGKDVDGLVGPKTLGRLKSFIDKNGVLDQSYEDSEEFGVRNFDVLSTNFLNKIFLKSNLYPGDADILTNSDGSLNDLYSIVEKSHELTDLGKDDLLKIKDSMTDDYVNELFNVISLLPMAVSLIVFENLKKLNPSNYLFKTLSKN